MEFKVGTIVKNIHVIRHAVMSSTYTTSTSEKVKIHEAQFEPESWDQYENIEIPCGTLFEIIDMCGMLISLEEPPDYTSCRFLVKLLKPIDGLDRDWFEQPAVFFQPSTTGEVLYGKETT